MQEVVSFGLEACGPAVSVKELQTTAAPHVSPSQFHALLEEPPHQQRPKVLLDVRNLYETRVGYFAKVCDQA
jgi:predicted sulfurtransferase